MTRMNKGMNRINGLLSIGSMKSIIYLLVVAPLMIKELKVN